jgi:hypothetical protein
MIETNDTQPMKSLWRFLPGVSGLLILAVAVASLPWLPIKPSSQDSTRPREVTQRSVQTTEAPAPAFGQDGAFTIHLVSSSEEITALRVRFPNPTLNVIIPVPLDEEWSLGDLRRIMAEEPASLQAKVMDYRCSPAPPPSQLCDPPTAAGP